MKKYIGWAFAALSVAVFVQAAQAAECDIKIVNHTSNQVIVQLWVLNYGATDLDVMVDGKATACYKKSTYDHKSWVADPKSVLNAGNATIVYPDPKDPTGVTMLVPQQSAHIPHGHTLNVYAKHVTVK